MPEAGPQTPTQTLFLISNRVLCRPEAGRSSGVVFLSPDLAPITVHQWYESEYKGVASKLHLSYPN